MELQEWNVLIVAGTNFQEVEVLMNQNGTWSSCALEDSCKAQMPQTEEDRVCFFFFLNCFICMSCIKSDYLVPQLCTGVPLTLLPRNSTSSELAST
jgi:hypothetical protein